MSSTHQICQHAHGECDGKSGLGQSVHGTVASIRRTAVGRSRVLIGITKRGNSIVPAGSGALSIEALAKSAVPNVESIRILGATFATRGGGFLLDAVVVAIDWAECLSIGR